MAVVTVTTKVVPLRVVAMAWVARLLMTVVWVVPRLPMAMARRRNND